MTIPGKVHLADITTQDVLAKTEKLKSTPKQYHYAFGIINTFFRWAIRNRYLERNPLEGMSVSNNLHARDRLTDACTGPGACVTAERSVIQVVTALETTLWKELDTDARLEERTFERLLHRR